MNYNDAHNMFEGRVWLTPEDAKLLEDIRLARSDRREEQKEAKAIRDAIRFYHAHLVETGVVKS